MSVTIYHNPRCGKSREGVKILEEMGIKFDTRLYLDEALSKKELKDLIMKLGISPEELLRKKEIIFKENYSGKDLSDEDCISAMIAYPKLIERPIVVNNDKAIIGRPPALIKDIF